MDRISMGEDVSLKHGVKWEIEDNNLYSECIEYGGINEVDGMRFFNLLVFRKVKSIFSRGYENPGSFSFALDERRVFAGYYAIQVNGEPLDDVISLRYVGKRTPKGSKGKWDSDSHRGLFSQQKE